jgi:hypothetical protein
VATYEIRGTGLSSTNRNFQYPSPTGWQSYSNSGVTILASENAMLSHVACTHALSLRCNAQPVKQDEQEADHSIMDGTNGGAIPSIPIHPHGAMLNYLNNRITFSFTLPYIKTSVMQKEL